MRKARTLQINDKLLIVNMREPLMYVDLTQKKLHVYKSPIKYFYKKRLANYE